MTPCDLSHFPSRDFEITYNQFQLRKFKPFGSFDRRWCWRFISWAPNSKLFSKSIDDCGISPSSATSDLHGIRRYWSTSKLHPCLNLLFDNKYLLPPNCTFLLLVWVHLRIRGKTQSLCGKLFLSCRLLLLALASQKMKQVSLSGQHFPGLLGRR